MSRDRFEEDDEEEDDDDEEEEEEEEVPVFLTVPNFSFGSFWITVPVSIPETAFEVGDNEVLFVVSLIRREL